MRTKNNSFGNEIQIISPENERVCLNLLSVLTESVQTFEHNVKWGMQKNNVLPKIWLHDSRNVQNEN